MIISFFIGLIITLLSLFFVRPLAIKIGLVDHPTRRKKHNGQIPLVGGLCIFLGLLVSQIYFNEIDKSKTLISMSLLILILGIWDDMKNLKAKTKLFFQLLIVGFTIYFTGISVENLGNLFGFSYELKLGHLSVPFTIVAVVGLINAFNMIDGLDGLAGILTILAILGIFSSGLYLHDLNFFNVLLALVGGLIPFLVFNIFGNNKIKIFLGDGGSLFLGFFVAFSLVFSAQNEIFLTPTFALWCVAVPVYDFLVVIILRKIEKRSLMMANRDHIHHFLENFSLTKIEILITIALAALSFLFIGHFLEIYFRFLSFWIYLLLFCLYLIMRLSLRNKEKFV